MVEPQEFDFIRPIVNQYGIVQSVLSPATVYYVDTAIVETYLGAYQNTTPITHTLTTGTQFFPLDMAISHASSGLFAIQDTVGETPGGIKYLGPDITVKYLFSASLSSDTLNTTADLLVYKNNLPIPGALSGMRLFLPDAPACVSSSTIFILETNDLLNGYIYVNTGCDMSIEYTSISLVSLHT